MQSLSVLDEIDLALRRPLSMLGARRITCLYAYLVGFTEAARKGGVPVADSEAGFGRFRDWWMLRYEQEPILSRSWSSWGIEKWRGDETAFEKFCVDFPEYRDELRRS